MVEAIAEHVRTNYSMYGAEVGAVSKSSLNILLPEEMPITELAADLWNLFDATIDIKYANGAKGAVLVVHAPQQQASSPAQQLSTPIGQGFHVAICLLALLIYLHYKDLVQIIHVAFNKMNSLM